ncbi:MAG: DUF1453 domain-containing protein [Rhodanobacteraceae bacterium]|nr:DUF1453 family protein [Pseudomonadota bacterium]
MTLSPHAMTLAVAIALIALMMSRRARRNFGRQPVQPKRMTTRIVILAIVGALTVIVSLADMRTLTADLGGLVAGVALGWWGLRLTRFEREPDGVHYIPHSWFGIAITALLAARIVYRFVVVMPGMQAAGQTMGPTSPFAAYQKSPLTLALFGLLVGYYICYYAGVLIVARRTPPGTIV